MNRAAEGDLSVPSRPMNLVFEVWLSIANLILACDDQVAMQRFVDLLNRVTCRTKRSLLVPETAMLRGCFGQWHA